LVDAYQSSISNAGTLLAVRGVQARYEVELLEFVDDDAESFFQTGHFGLLGLLNPDRPKV
jgi:hypothetical protein